MNTIIVTLDSPLAPPAPPPQTLARKSTKLLFFDFWQSAFYINLRICRVLFKCRHKPIFLLNVSKYFYCTGKTPGSFVWVDKFLIYINIIEKMPLWLFSSFGFLIDLFSDKVPLFFFSWNFIILSCCKTSDFVFYIRQFLKAWIWNFVADLFFCRLQLKTLIFEKSPCSSMLIPGVFVC